MVPPDFCCLESSREFGITFRFTVHKFAFVSCDGFSMARWVHFDRKNKKKMNILKTAVSIAVFILLSWETSSFSSYRIPHGTRPDVCQDAFRRYKSNTRLSATSVKADEEVGTYDDSHEDDQTDLVIGFVNMVLRETPRGEMKADEVDLLREIMTDFPMDVKEVDPATVVESLLHRLLDEWDTAMRDEDEEREKIFRPLEIDFFRAISTWEKSDNADKVVHVLSLLSDQRELFLSDLETIKPELETIKSVLRTLAASRERGLDKRASVVFNSLQDYGLVADAEIYELLISIVAKSRARGAAERAEKLLREGIKHYPPQMVSGVVSGISTDAFNSVVTAYAKSGEDRGPEKAENLIMYMDQIDTDNGSLGVCSPTINTFTSLIDAYAQQNEWEAATQADRILNQLLDQYLEGNDDLEPNIATWTIVINAWARLSKKNRNGAAERAGKLLKRMEDLWQAGRISHKPDAIAYVTCMNAFAFSKNGVGAEEAEKLLNEMNEYYLDGDDSMKPSARSIKIVVDSWVKNGDMERAEDFLDNYEDYLVSENEADVPEIVRDLYRSMLFGYTQQGDTSRAKFYLEYMIENGMEPDSFCFDRIIEANTRIAPEKNLKESLGIFELMEKCRQAGTVQPDERVYTSFIRALTKGRPIGLHKKADVLLQRMKKLSEQGSRTLKPSIFTYNAVIFACAESLYLEDDSSEDAFKTAVKVFNELRNSKERPDHVTYGNMIRCSRLLPDGEQKNKFVSATFRLCCEKGYVNSFVVRDLQECVSEDLWRELLGCRSGPVELDFLPSDWSYMIDRKGSSIDKGGFKRGSKRR